MEHSSLAEPDTLPKYLLQTAARYGSKKVAMRKKELGIWREYSWQESLDQVKYLTLGLLRLGLTRGDKVAILGENDPSITGRNWPSRPPAPPPGIFTDCAPKEVRYIVDHCDASFVFAKDQEQCDKLLAIRDEIPRVKRVIYWDPKGLWNYSDPWLLAFDDVAAQGKEHQAAQPGLFEQTAAQGQAADVGIFCYTSGTTGLPKGAMITHGNMIFGYQAATSIDPRLDTDDYLSFLPLAWITEHVLGLTVHVISGMVVNFPEEPETVQSDLREIAPRSLLFSSRLWESLASTVQARINDSSRLKQALYHAALPIGHRVVDLRDQGKTPGLFWRIAYALANLTVFRPLRDKLGLTQVRSAYTAGAALSPDVVRFFQAIGVNIKQLFGSTEAIIHTVHRHGDIRMETVGPPAPGVELKIAEDGEILVNSPAVFCGYYKDPVNTAEKLRDGWFHTGDAGHLTPEGHLIYLDRVKDMLELAGGARFSPQYIEGRLKFSPYVKDCMVLGGKEREFVTAIVNIDFENVGKWAERRRIAYTTFVDLSQKPEVYALIRQDVERVNHTLPEPARVRKFVLLHKEFDADEAELTRTRKLRRGPIEERYRQMIEAMYTGQDQVNVRAEVKYRDGRTGTVETPVKVCSL